MQLIGNQWIEGNGQEWISTSPVDGRECWRGRFADSDQAEAAAQAAARAFHQWSRTSLEDRIAVCRAFADHLTSHKQELAETISWETGKPLWESLTEVATSIAKVTNSIDAQRGRRWTTSEMQGELSAVTRYKPHGVMLVLGPFNLPAHLPGAHIVPALLAGNTIVFKPSELTPSVGQWLAHAWQSAGLPAGCLNLVHGQAAIAQQLAAHSQVAGVLFTGSYRAGASLHKLLAGQPEKLLALEMGGNNPLVVHKVEQLAAAVMQIIESAYITSGQRCTCARRLILTESAQPDRLIGLLTEAIAQIRCGLPMDEPAPFMGTLIRPSAAQKLLDAQTNLIDRGALPIVRMEPQARSKALISPGLLDTTGMQLEDEEHFGPLLCIQRVATLDHAIDAANTTRFGLSAGLLADDPEDYQQFIERIRAGIVNWNRQTTGASGRLPFGGIGASGNHAPSGFFAADYCAYPVASLESSRLPSPADGKYSPGLDQVVTLCLSN